MVWFGYSLLMIESAARRVQIISTDVIRLTFSEGPSDALNTIHKSDSREITLTCYRMNRKIGEFSGSDG